MFVLALDVCDIVMLTHPDFTLDETVQEHDWMRQASKTVILFPPTSV